MKTDKKQFLKKHPGGILIGGTISASLCSFVLSCVLLSAICPGDMIVRDLALSITGLAGITSYVAILIWMVRIC